MKQLLLCIGILLFTSVVAIAHNGAINGTITNATSKQGIENASITIVATSIIAYSNEQGFFEIKDVKQGKYVIQISHFAFETKIIEVVVSNYIAIISNVVLQSKPFNLQEVKISSNQRITKNIINKINIERIPINSSQDMLRVVPGLIIAQHAGGGKSEQIFLRGFDCDHGTDIAIGVDGMPVNMVSHAHGQGYADLHFVIPEMVEQIQVNKGGYQVSVGDFSTAGNIQLVTKKYLPSNTLIFEKGNFNNNRVVAMMNILSKKLQEKQNLIVAGEYLFNKGFFESPMNLNRFNLLSKYNLQPNAKNFINLHASYFHSFWNASGQIPERAIYDKSITRFGSIDSTEGGLTTRFNASFEIKNNFKTNAVLKQQLYYNRYQFELYSNFTFFKNDTVNGDMIMQKEARDIVGYNGSFNIDSKIKGVELSTTIGLQARYDHVIGSELSNVKQQKIFLKPISLGDINQINTAVYFDQNMAINKNLKVNLGLRFDIFGFNYDNKYNSNSFKETVVKGNLSPKANLFYMLNKNAQFFVMFGKSFHSNDTRVVVEQKGQKILPSSFGSEMGMILKPNKNAILTVSLWQLDLQQEFVYVGDESVVEASGATRRVGADIGIRYQISKNVTADIDVNYAFARSKNEPSDANRIPLAPSFTSIGGLMYKTNNGVLASLRYRHLADRAANETNTETASGYTILDAVFKYPFKKMQFGFQVENLLNTKWKEAQFELETKLKNEAQPVSEIHFTSGTPLQIKFSIGFTF